MCATSCASIITGAIAKADIYGRLVNANGTMATWQFPISTAADGQWHPAVAYNSSTTQFLVVWFDNRNASTTGDDIYARLVNANGTMATWQFPISTAADGQYSPAVAYNSSTNQFLVAWQDWRNSASTGVDIYGRLVNANGSMAGPQFPISLATDNQLWPAVAYNSSTNQFLVVWDDERNWVPFVLTKDIYALDIYARLVNGNGTMAGPQFPISLATNEQWYSDVAYNSSTNQFLVVWSDGRNSSTTEHDIYGRRYAP